MPSRLSQFWQELKRRKVTRTITVYAAAAFVVLELVSIIVEPLKLPEWTLPFIIVLLCVGFVIAVILSWIYDIHPEGGIVKTEPAHKVKAEDMPKSSNSWKIASYISFVVIVGLIILNILPRVKRTEQISDLETSIAVLPFENMSEDASYSHIGGAFTDEIIMELQKIKAFDRVLSRTSTMQYDENRPTIPEISEKLNVNYIIEGSIQRLERRVRVRVQVIRAKNEDHIWGDTYDEEYVIPDDILDIQSRIAQSVADELKVRITPEEMELIGKVPTTSLTAYDFYLRGREEHIKYRVDNNNTVALERAEQLYHDALEKDPDYARAYVGLASAYWDKHYWSTYWSEDFLDSVLIYVNMALKRDDRLAEAYSLKGDYYRELGNNTLALKAYETAIELNPNDWSAFEGASDLYEGQKDLEKAFEYLHKSVRLNHDQELPRLMHSLGSLYFMYGFPEKTKYYLDEAFKLDGDSVQYYYWLRNIETYNNDDYTKSIELINLIYRTDTNNVTLLECLGDSYELLKQFDMALVYYKKMVDRLESLPLERHNNLHHVAYCYWKLGKYEETQYYLDLQKQRCELAIDLSRDYAKGGGAYYDLACVYAFKGDKSRAYENLHLFLSTLNGAGNTFIVWFMNRDPFFDSMRNEPEFQQILSDVEAKYLAERERVRKWLEENDML